MTTTALSAAAATRLATDAAAPACESAEPPQPDAAQDQEARQHGQHHAEHLQRLGRDVDESPVAATRQPRRRRPRCTTAHAVPSSRGTAATRVSSMNASIGTTTSTHSVTTARAHGLSTAVSGCVPAPRQQAEQGRLDPVEQVGDAGEVGEHVVAVEAHQRQSAAAPSAGSGWPRRAAARRTRVAHQTPAMATATIALKYRPPRSVRTRPARPSR